MASLAEIVRDKLLADATLVALLPGGIYAVKEIKRSDSTVAAAFDANGEIKPCANVKEALEQADGPIQFAGRAFLTIYFYEFSGYATTVQARARIHTLLHRQKVGVAADKIWEVNWVNDIPGGEDPALECSLEISRYQVMRYRG